MIKSKQHQGCRIQDPGTRGYWWWKTAGFWHSAGTAPIVTLCIPETPLKATRLQKHA